MDAITEDRTLGLDAHTKGFSLGLIDRYVQDSCPAEFGKWVRQKRRWVAGPYPYLRSDDVDPGELVRVWVDGASKQVISVPNTVGVPAGTSYFQPFVAGYDLTGRRSWSASRP